MPATLERCEARALPPRMPIAYSLRQGCGAQANAAPEAHMALITIKDLPQSDDLDREAMRSIVGGGPIGARPVQSERVKAGSSRIVDYPPGFVPQGPLPAGSQRPVG